jgi:hypothetical protein
MDPHKELEAILDALNASGLDYAVCGGLALAVYGLPRATKDVDVLIRFEDLEKVKDAVRKVGFTLTSGMIPFRSGTPEETKLYRVTKVEDTEFLILDLLLVTPILDEAWASRETLKIGEREVTVVSKEGLIGMKERAGRPQDLVDIENLKGLKEND